MAAIVYTSGQIEAAIFVANDEQGSTVSFCCMEIELLRPEGIITRQMFWTPFTSLLNNL
jgi:hypothetical protein